MKHKATHIVVGKTYGARANVKCEQLMEKSAESNNEYGMIPMSAVIAPILQEMGTGAEDAMDKSDIGNKNEFDLSYSGHPDFPEALRIDSVK